MGAAACKNSKSTATAPTIEEIKRITIAVFGLENVGKTSTINAIEGVPTKAVTPTTSSSTSTVRYPASLKSKNKGQEGIEIIDVSGKENFRERSWADFYDRVHGFIFVVDASDKKGMPKSQRALKDLLGNSKLREKPLLILANKQDQERAIKDEEHLKEKLDIEDLRTTHKIKFCRATPNNNKVDVAISEGFSWLIGEIEKDYAKLNDRVKPSTSASRPKSPMSRKPGNFRKSDHSDMEDEVVYGANRRNSPPLSSRRADHRSPNTSMRLPQLELNKPKRKPDGYHTYSENEDDNDHTDRSRSRPNISIPISDRHDRDISHTQSSLAATSGFNKKKKVIGAGVGYNEIPGKKITGIDPTPFRSSYEPFPDDSPWSGTTSKPATQDRSLPSKPYLKTPVLNDSVKRSMSPLIRDLKPLSTDTTSKRDKGSDDDDDDITTSQRDRNKPLYPPINRSRDDDYLKYTSPSSTIRPLSTPKKPSSGLYGSDDDDYGGKTIMPRQPNAPSRLAGTAASVKKPFKYDNDSDNEDKYRKKPDFGTGKTVDSDDDERNKDKHKTYDRPSDRFKSNEDYYGITARSSPPKPISQPTAASNDHLSKSLPLKSRLPSDDDDDHRSPSTSRFGALSKYGNDDDDYKFKSKPTVGERYSGNRPSSPVRSTSLAQVNGNNERGSLFSKSPARPNFDDDDDDYRRPSPSKPTSHSRFDDDDDRPGSLTRIPSRSKLNDDHRPSPSKGLSRSKFEGDDDDDDRPLPSSKPPPYTKYDDDDYSAGTGGRFRSGNNEFDSSRGGSNNGRIGSATNNRPRHQTNYDD